MSMRPEAGKRPPPAAAHTGAAPRARARARRRPPPGRQRAFSLVEMAIVLVIVGLLIGGLLGPLTAQIEQRHVADTQKSLDEAREALIGFALRNGYLPCPAISASNGLEDRSGNRCTNERRQGYLPWATLGVSKLDGWGRLFHYSVTPAYADSLALFKLATPRDITVGSRDGAGAIIPASAANDVPALILSHGKNGFGATSDAGVRQADISVSNQDERLNANAVGTSFVSRIANDNPELPGGEFDDIVVWISPYVLFNRMVGAQKLP